MKLSLIVPLLLLVGAGCSSGGSGSVGGSPSKGAPSVTEPTEKGDDLPAGGHVTFADGEEWFLTDFTGGAISEGKLTVVATTLEGDREVRSIGITVQAIVRGTYSRPQANVVYEEDGVRYDAIEATVNVERVGAVGDVIQGTFTAKLQEYIEPSYTTPPEGEEEPPAEPGSNEPPTSRTPRIRTIAGGTFKVQRFGK